MRNALIARSRKGRARFVAARKIRVGGEVFILRRFGCGIQRLVFEGPDPIALASTEYLVSTAIRRHLRDLISLDAVRVTVADATILVDVLYTLLGTGEESAVTIAQPLEAAP